MSPGAIIIDLLGGVVLLALVLLALALFSPVVLTLDSENWEVRVRWLVALVYWRRLAGGGEEFSFAGRPIRLRARRERPSATADLSGAGAPKAAKPKPQKNRERTARLARFARGCLKHAAVRALLVRTTKRLWRGLARSASLKRLRIALSLPDPAWNGMLMGCLAASGGGGVPGWSLPDLRVNFAGENSCLIEARLYPYRVVKALIDVLAGLLVGLPYGTLWREWRASAA